MGNISEYVKMAVQNILAKKGCSFLTMVAEFKGIASETVI